MSAVRTARERARAELTNQITEAARRRLATESAAGLSLRAIARELGMVSSAIHRYFPTKDDLLTALIVDGYNALGEFVEQAETAVEDRSDLGARWYAAASAIRDWAVRHPHEYALLYGSPVPGYAAPSDTIEPAGRAIVVLGGVIAEANRAGVLNPPAIAPTPPPAFHPDAERLRALVPGVDDELAARSVTVITAIFGWVSFDLFGQFENGITDRGLAYDLHVRTLGRLLGLPDPDATG